MKVIRARKEAERHSSLFNKISGSVRLRHSVVLSFMLTGLLLDAIMFTMSTILKKIHNPSLF